MSDLTEFLLARIAEDEAVARAASHGPWLHNPRKEWFTDPDKLRAARAGIRQSGGEEHVSAGEGAIGVAATGPTDEPRSMADADHIARHNPIRVLAECEAKRRIIAFHEHWPVLVEKPVEFGPVSGDVNKMVFRASQQIAWATEQEYRTRFGIEPPTAPMLLALAAPYADHPDFHEEWRA